MDTFYVVCPSNTPEVNNAGAPRNSLSNFSVRLPNTLDLSDGEWSVALSSIIYPVSFQADSVEEMSIGIVYANNKERKTINLPADLTFSSIEHLERTVNETILGHVIEKPRMTRSLPPEEEKEQETEEFERDKRDGVALTDKEEKMLIAASNEVKTRSYTAAQEQGSNIEDKISEIELMGAKIEAMHIGIETRIIINENFSKEEAEDLERKVKQAREDGVKIRNNAQLKRTDLAAVLSLYGKLISDFEVVLQAKNVSEARRMANKAKEFVNNLVDMAKWLDEDKKSVKIIYDYLTETNKDLSQMLKPMDLGMKNTIARIKEAILAKVGNVKLGQLEVYFYFDQNYGRFFLYNHKPLEIKAVSLSPRLAFMLGFEIDKFSHEVKHVRIRRDGGFAKYTPDIKAGIHQLYVYMPGIIDSTYVGNVQAPLLRIINVDKPPNSIVESIYSNMHFIKVIEKRISSIKIQIHDAFGEFIKFNWGTIIVTLAFKRSLF